MWTLCTYHGFEGVKGERGDSIRVTRQLVERREGAQVIHIGLQWREGGRERGRKGGREGGRERGRKGGRERGRKGGRVGGREGEH